MDLKMDTFLIEEANEDDVSVYFMRSGKLLRKLNIKIMVYMKRKYFIWQNVNSIFTHLKVLKYFLQKL